MPLQRARVNAVGALHAIHLFSIALDPVWAMQFSVFIPLSPHVDILFLSGGPFAIERLPGASTRIVVKFEGYAGRLCLALSYPRTRRQ